MPEVPAPYISLVPDWVCEVLSASTTTHDRERKMPGNAKPLQSHGGVDTYSTHCHEERYTVRFRTVCGCDSHIGLPSLLIRTLACAAE